MLDLAPAASGCKYCQYWDAPDGYVHQFLGQSCSEIGNGCFDCFSFNACHSNIQDGTCWSGHNYCSGGDDFAAIHGIEGLPGLEKGATLGKLVSLQQRFPASLVLNRSRGLMQVIDCRGQVAAQVSVRAIRMRAA